MERNVRTLIQELIDNKVEPEDFCDKLERLLNASPQPCLIGFLKVSRQQLICIISFTVNMVSCEKAIFTTIIMKADTLN